MTVYKYSKLFNFESKANARTQFVVSQSTGDAIDMASRTATGITRGGELKPGHVPRADGILAASLVSTLHGSTSITSGDGNYSLVVGSMKTGDVATFFWTAPYAKRQHYEIGWHWVTKTVEAWPGIVAKKREKSKGAIPMNYEEVVVAMKVRLSANIPDGLNVRFPRDDVQELPFAHVTFVGGEFSDETLKGDEIETIRQTMVALVTTDLDTSEEQRRPGRQHLRAQDQRRLSGWASSQRHRWRRDHYSQGHKDRRRLRGRRSLEGSGRGVFPRQ